MKKNNKKGYELIAKRCPDCRSLIMAKIDESEQGRTRYIDHCCSKCDWTSPSNSSNMMQSGQ